MEIDSKMIINIVIATVISLIIAVILAFLTGSLFSFIIGVFVAGAIMGFFADSIDNALVVGGAAGLLVSILQGIIAPFVLPHDVAVLMPILDSFLGFIVAGAFASGVVALVKDIRS